MAITLIQERKKQRYLLLVFAFTVLAIVLIIWFGFFSKKPVEEPISITPAVVYAAPDINIEWQALESLREEFFRPFEKIKFYQGVFGRENPFEPY